jgi:hypothetical protein
MNNHNDQVYDGRLINRLMELGTYQAIRNATSPSRWQSAITEYVPLTHFIESIERTVDGVMQAHMHSHVHFGPRTLCAWCYLPVHRHTVIGGRCDMSAMAPVFAPLLCDWYGPETRDGLCNGEPCGADAVVVGIESGQAYCEGHWRRISGKVGAR